MADRKAEIQKRLAEIERLMGAADFWAHKERAQAIVREYNDLKAEAAGVGKYDKGNAIITIFAGAGGDDAEDFARMLFGMYRRYGEKNSWEISILHKNENDHGGYRNLTFEIRGKNAYGTLKNESGVHRLVRISPFSAKKLRHTSFAMVEIIPELPKGEAIEIPESDIAVEFARSSGPGGQNVNKRETAVRIVHLPTNLSVHVDSERSQAQNRERALEILRGKLYRLKEAEAQKEEAGFLISKTTEAEWGSQIRSYVLHPYKLVKDHRTGIEVGDTEAVLEGGELDKFIEAEKNL
ncbi:MAG: PCRF domain-containing protein [Parcubacteria group bacterium]|nr:PCRF domain-containing protein [Parcubacteria group bacterium]